MNREYLKREDQILVLRLQNEDSRDRMAKDALDKDRANAHLKDASLDASAMQIDNEGETTAMGFLAEDGSTIAPSASAEILGSKTIVIHPGSQNMRIGLASDALPKTVPMVIARRWNESECEEGEGEEDPSPKRTKINGAIPYEPEKWFGDEVDTLLTLIRGHIYNKLILA